jgi:large subunit ribosomal protein LP2
MKHLAAYLLLQLGGTTHPTGEEIKEVLGSVGIDADQGRLDHLLRELQGRDINEVCSLFHRLSLCYARLAIEGERRG